MDHDRRLLMMLMIGLIPLFLLFLPVPGTGMKLKDISELWASDSTIWIEGIALLMTSALAVPWYPRFQGCKGTSLYA